MKPLLLIILICLPSLAVFAQDATTQASPQKEAIPYEVRLFVARIEVNQDGVIIVLKDKPKPLFMNNHFKNGRLFISREDDLSKYRLETSLENEDLLNYAFIYYHSAGEEDNHYLYLKEIKGNTAMFHSEGSHSRGDGWSDFYEREFMVDKVFYNQ